jgi:hypothetical protein
MPYERTGYAPWSLTREAGVQSATVDGTVQVPQYIQPTLNTGFVDERGNWKGIKSSDETFFISAKAEGVANGGAVLFPNTADKDFIDMTGYSDVTIAILPTNGGDCQIHAVMGPDTHSYANLSPVNPNAVLRGHDNTTTASIHDLISDGAETMTTDVWNIFTIQTTLRNQKLLQFRIVNNSGGNSDIDFAYLRLV